MLLADLQRAFQDHVLHEGRTIEAAIAGSAQFPAAARLGIYSDAYRLRLIDVLAYYYPRLQKLLGDDAFARLALHYLAAQPSRHISVRWFGDGLADELARSIDQGIDQNAEYREQPWLAELARWECALATAFDASDAEPLTLEAFGEIDPAHWPDLRFQFDPSVQLLRFQTNAPGLFQALAAGTETPDPAVLDTAQTWLIWRQDLKPWFRLLSDAETEALATMRGQSSHQQQGTFEELCETLCQFHDPGEVPSIAASMLKTWITQGLIIAVLLN
jgi:hypothetical protein